MKRNFLCVCLCLLCIASLAQKQKNTTISFEIGKSSVIYGLYFDHKFLKSNFGLRLGGGSNFDKYLNALSLGGGGYYLLGKRKSFFELGLDIHYLKIDDESFDQRGFVFVYPTHSISTYYISSNLGFRNYGKKTLFRIGFSPGFIKDDFVPGGYISFGIRF